MELRSRRILSGASSTDGQFPNFFLSICFSFLEVLFGYWENEVNFLFFFFGLCESLFLLFVLFSFFFSFFVFWLKYLEGKAVADLSNEL